MQKQEAIGTWKLSRDYLDAGTKLDITQNPFKVCMPAYFLFGHAIELAFKSFLISQGITEKELRKLGHDLEAAMQAAFSHETLDVYLSETQQSAIIMLNPYYLGKELEYLAVGVKTFPDIIEVAATAHALVMGVKPIVEVVMRDHLIDF